MSQDQIKISSVTIFCVVYKTDNIPFLSLTKHHFLLYVIAL